MSSAGTRDLQQQLKQGDVLASTVIKQLHILRPLVTLQLPGVKALAGQLTVTG